MPGEADTELENSICPDGIQRIYRRKTAGNLSAGNDARRGSTELE